MEKRIINAISTCGFGICFVIFAHTAPPDTNVYFKIVISSLGLLLILWITNIGEKS